jgi:hypothetical protein
MEDYSREWKNQQKTCKFCVSFLIYLGKTQLC